MTADTSAIGVFLRFRLLPVATLAVSVGLIVGCASEPPTVAEQTRESLPTSTAPTTQTAATPTATTTTSVPVRIGIFGDSISEANSPDFASGRFGALSWASYLDEGFTFAGGWAKSGARTTDMLAHAEPLSADVLVILAGTNDYANGVTFEQTTAHLDGIVARAGVQRVIVSTVPPNDLDPRAAAAFNEKLAGLAQARGWTLVDAAAGLRSGERFAPGMTTDGIHPTEAGAEVIGGGIAEAVRKNL